MTNSAVVQCVQGVFLDSCTTLLTGLNGAATEIDSDRGDLLDVPIARIDAGSNDIELIICLQFPVSVLALTYPIQEDITGVDEERLEDWISELSNQLVGKVKNKLLSHNCLIALGLPTSHFGSGVQHLLSKNGEVKSLYFDVDGETCAFHISVEVFEDDMVFSLEEHEGTESVDDGEMELF
jgi:hypothetical protein